MLTDGVINIAPGLPEKTDIIRNAIGLAHRLGLAEPKIAIVAAVETVNPAMPSDDRRGRALQDGRSRTDHRRRSRRPPSDSTTPYRRPPPPRRRFASAVAGDPDILVVPSLEAGNILYKSFVYMGRAACAGVVLGARVPVILTSRADSEQARIAFLRPRGFGRGRHLGRRVDVLSDRRRP